MCCDRKLADNCDQDQLGQLRSRARQKSAQLLQALIINTCETLKHDHLDIQLHSLWVFARCVVSRDSDP